MSSDEGLLVGGKDVPRLRASFHPPHPWRMNVVHHKSRRTATVAAVIAMFALAGLVALTLVGPGTAVAASCPHRIVSISPTATETLFAIGAGPQVVAVDSQSNYPAGAPRKSGLIAYSPSGTAIYSDYHPDLVVESYDANHVTE